MRVTLVDPPAEPDQGLPEPPGGGRGDEARLVRCAREGDRVAFGRLHERYAPMIHCILLARVPRSETADLVQEVFLAALRQLPSLHDDGAFGPWIAMIARNRALDFHRRARAPPVIQLVENPPDERARSEEEAEAARALEAIRGLPEAYRETLVLRLAEGFTGPEIAALTGLTPESVRVNLHRGMKKLREALGMKGERP